MSSKTTSACHPPRDLKSTEILELSTGKKTSLVQRGQIETEGEDICYELSIVDARSSEQQKADESYGHLGGNLIVIIPGHGQTYASTRNLAATAAAMSKSKVVWLVDIAPPRGGDPIKAKVLANIIKRTASTMFPWGDGQETESGISFRVTLVGWSHGGGEALQSAPQDPMFEQVVGLCPTGLVERSALELILSFILESLRIVWAGMLKRDAQYLQRTLAVGFDIFRGIFRDFLRSRSLSRIIGDIRWAAKKVAGESYPFTGDVLLVFGKRDTVNRWQDVFPNCAQPTDIPRALPDFQRDNFALARRVKVVLIDGNHLSPEIEAQGFVRQALAFSGQLQEDQCAQNNSSTR